jgi:class 3 adenylate cyclase
MKCSKCGHEATAGDIFCSRCGTKLETVCPKCGNKCREGDLFCSKCGTKLDVGATHASPEQAVEEAIPKLEDMHAQLQSLIPDALAQKYLTAEQEAAGENRLITALFADISGFTSLSASQSSEAMFQLVQDCFKQLVSIVANYEGSISGFRGDGLLALFGAPILHENDAERAILAALDMRSNMQDRQLEVSIGINTAMMTVGEIQTQLHREYTAYGTDINLAKRLQEAAQPGQILAGAATYRVTRRAFDFEILPSLSLKGLPQPVTACVVQQVKPHPEKLRGIEGLRARMIGREREFAELKEATDSWLQGQGQIVSIIGEAGIGKSRLVSELRTYLAQISPNPPLQRGEKREPLLKRGKTGPPQKGEKTGPLLKEGERDHLQKEGKRDYPAGDLSDEAGDQYPPLERGEKRGTLQTERKKDHPVGNLSDEVRDQYPPLERGVRGDFPAGDLTDEIFDQPRCLEGRCISIGQPISYWPFLDILRAYFGLSEEDDAATRARKVTEATTHLFPQSADEVLPFLGRLFSISFGNELDDRLKFAAPEQIRHQTLMRLRDFFERLARKQPLLLILEDLHWADDLSLDLLSLLMDELPTTPFMLLCVYRPERQHRVWQLSDQARRKCLDRYTEITLNPLSSRESRQLVETLLTIEYLPESVKEMILQKSEGNPFFIEEVIRSLIEQDLVYREGDHWRARAEVADIHVPDTIQSVLLARVDRLQAEAKYVLQCASVIGRLFKYRLLEHLTQQERNLDRYLSEFEERELVYEERTVPELEYAFKHALTQEATYQGILERRRREFHHQVAVGIERLYRERLDEYYDELAHHYSRSGNAEKALEYFLKAGEKATKSYANEAAISYFQKALETLKQYRIERGDWELEALRGLGEVYVGVGKITEAEKTFEEAIELARDMELPPHPLVRLYNWIGEVLWWQSRHDEMIRYGEMGLELLGDDTECLEAALMNSRIGVPGTYP